MLKRQNLDSSLQSYNTINKGDNSKSATTVPIFTLLIHLYYPGSWNLILEKCPFIIESATKIIITACHDDVIVEAGYSTKTTILKVTNKGKDIGGKLASLSYYLEFCNKTPYLIFLHDKISPQTINADFWLNKLYGIFKKEVFIDAIEKLNQDGKIGIVGSKHFLRNEYMRRRKKFGTTNDILLRKLISQYELSCKQYNFIAGTIFISKSVIFERFFSKHSPLDARENLELGNVLDLSMGTYTHSWERLLCFIAEDQGYSIKGV